MQRDGVQPMVTVDDTIEAEIIFKADANVQRLVRELYGIHNIEEVACDPWYYGARFGALPLSRTLLVLVPVNRSIDMLSDTPCR